MSSYVSPPSLKEKAVSYNFSDHKKFSFGIKNAIETGKMRGVFGYPDFIELSSNERQSYFTFFHSVFGKEELKGVIFSVLKLDYLLNHKVATQDHIDFTIIDTLPNQEAKIIYSSDVNVLYPSPIREKHNFIQKGYHYENIMNVAGHRFLIEFFPNKAFYVQSSHDVWIIFIICIVVSLMVAVYIRMSQKYTSKLVNAQKETEQANALQRDFLATMSHEIRTPMNAIIGMGDLLLDEGLEPHHARRVKTIVGAGEGLLQILNDILDFSKIEAGKLDMEELSFSPCEVVEDLADLHALQAQNKGVELTVWQNSKIPDLVLGDQGRVRQILNNLVSNAIKFTHEGHILIQIELLETTSKNEAVLKFSVKDTGIGIPEAVQGLVFDRFRQADSSTTRQFGGTGLGLAICKKLTAIMRGEMGLESKEREGSHFWFTAILPIDKTVHKKIDVGADLKNISIAVIDDIEINLEILTSYLKRWNAEVSVFSDPQDALENIQKKNKGAHPYDVILTDHLMPDMSGIALMQFLRKDPSAHQTPSILISSYMDVEANRALKKMEDVYHLSKPIHPERLKSMILKIIGRYKQESESLVQKLNTETLNFSNVRVLVAEDNYANQEIAEKILERMGCSVTCVGNGKEAIETLSTLPFDIVFMDCQMPEMDGFEATAVITDLIFKGKIKNTPIVALTANAMKGDKERCLEAGMQDYISKPVKKNAFKDILAKWLPEKINVEEEAEESSEEKSEDTSLVNYSEPLFDEEIYGELKEMIGDESAHSILIKYRNSTLDDQKIVSDHFEKRDYKTVSEYAHKLKSSSAQIGAIRLSRISADIESYFREEGDLTKMVSYVNEYKAVLDDTLAELEKRVSAG